MEFKKFLHLISKYEKGLLPGEASQFKMSPPFRKTLLEGQGEKIKQAKRAGVIALFYPDKNSKTSLVLILRKTYKGVHSAQIAFPGGKYEEEDKTLQVTAIRETYEEIGVPKEDIQIIDALTQVYIPPSNFYVYPFLGICNTTPKFIKQDEEVELIVEVALDHFMDDNMVITASVPTSYKGDVKVPAFKLNNYVVWGATAMMLSEIKDLLKAMS